MIGIPNVLHCSEQIAHHVVRHLPAGLDLDDEPRAFHPKEATSRHDVHTSVGTAGGGRTQESLRFKNGSNENRELMPLKGLGDLHADLITRSRATACPLLGRVDQVVVGFGGGSLER